MHNQCVKLPAMERIFGLVFFGTDIEEWPKGLDEETKAQTKANMFIDLHMVWCCGCWFCVRRRKNSNERQLTTLQFRIAINLFFFYDDMHFHWNAPTACFAHESDIKYSQFCLLQFRELCSFQQWKSEKHIKQHEESIAGYRCKQLILFFRKTYLLKLEMCRFKWPETRFRHPFPWHALH